MSNKFPIITAGLRAHVVKSLEGEITRRGSTPQLVAKLRDQPDNRVTRFLDAVQTVETAHSNGAISNVSFKDTKELINRDLEYAWDAAIKTPLIYEPMWAKRETNPNYRAEDDVNDIVYSPQIHTINSFFKKINKIKSDPALKEAALAFLNEIKPVADMFEDLKTKIVKRVPKPVEDVKAKYLAPRASGTAMAFVQKALMDVTEAAYGAVKQQFLDRYNQIIISYGRAMDKARSEGKKIPSPHTVFCSNRQFPDYESREICDKVFYNGLLSPKKDAILESEATKNADDIRDMFVIKNLKKLDSIIEKKNNFSNIEIVGRDISMGRLTGMFKITFTDGSSFIAKNMVVWATSVYGRQFNRFPLTFHNVVLANGEKMGQPSEERMNTIFVE